MGSVANLKGTLGRPANPEARALRRDQILAGARACFLRKGFHAATTAEIAAEARVSVANLYQYFPTKNDLIHALVEEDLEQDLAIVRMVDEARTIREGLELTTALIATDPVLLQQTQLRLEILAEASRNPSISEVVQRADRRMVSAMASLIRRRREAGEVVADLDPEVAAHLILALFDGLIGRFSFRDVDPQVLSAAADRMILAAFGSE